MSQICNDNIKRPKLQDIPLEILKICTFYQKIQQRVSGPGENTAGVTQYLPLRIQTKTQWFREGCGWSIVVAQLRSVLRLHANTLIPDIYRRYRLNWQVHLELCHRNPDILERVLNRIAISNSTAGKCAPMQVIKQPEHERTSTTEEQN